MNLHTFSPSTPFIPVYLDGLDGQEDELEDVQKGELDPPTDDEGAGSIFEKNDFDRSLETDDEEEPEDDAVKQARLNP